MSLAKRAMLEEDTVDPAIYELSQKLKVMSVYPNCRSSLVDDFQKLDVFIQPSACSTFEGFKENRQKKIERFVLADQIELKKPSHLFQQSTLDRLARIARNKRYTLV